jgi:hypothetical protein
VIIGVAIGCVVLLVLGALGYSRLVVGSKKDSQAAGKAGDTNGDVEMSHINSNGADDDDAAKWLDNVEVEASQGGVATTKPTGSAEIEMMALSSENKSPQKRNSGGAFASLRESLFGKVTPCFE